MEIEESALERRAAGVDDDGEDGSIKMGGGGEGEEGDKSVAAARNEEFEEEDGETGQPLVAADEVADNLKVWARSLQRPPKGNLKSFSEGLWRPEQQLCRIIKPRGNDLRSMGFAFDGDIHLYPEETLFLVERCKLEVGNLTTPELYEAVDLYHYLTYAYFRQTSLIVFRVDPAACPVDIAFEAYAPTCQFSKKNPGRPILYIMYGGTRAPVPTDEELVAIFKWADGVPVKYAMVSDEGGVFAVNLAHRPLENHTHMAAIEAQAAAAAAAAAAASAAVAANGNGNGSGVRRLSRRAQKREEQEQRKRKLKEMEQGEQRGGGEEEEGEGEEGREEKRLKTEGENGEGEGEGTAMAVVETPAAAEDVVVGAVEDQVAEAAGGENGDGKEEEEQGGQKQQEERGGGKEEQTT